MSIKSSLVALVSVMFLLVVISVTGCAPPPPTAITQVSEETNVPVPPTQTDIPTQTPTISPTTELPTQTPRPTIVPTATGTPPILPTLQLPPEALTIDSMPNIELVNEWGKGRIHQMVWIEDPDLIVLGTSNGVYLYDANSLEVVEHLKKGTWISGVAASAASRLMAISYDTTIEVWSLESFSVVSVIAEHPGPVNAMAFDGNGKLLASTNQGGDFAVRVWDVNTGILKTALTGQTAQPLSIAFHPLRPELAVSTQDYTYWFWNIETNKTNQILSDTISAKSLAYHPSGDFLAAGSLAPGSVVHLWDLVTGQVIHRMAGHEKEINAVLFSPNGEQLMSLSSDGRVLLWEVESGSLLQVFEGTGAAMWSGGFSNNKPHVAASSYIGVDIWDLDSGDLIASIPGHMTWIDKVRVTTSGKVIAAESFGNTIRVWDVEQNSVLHELIGHSQPITQIDITQDGRYLISGSVDQTSIIWDLETGAIHKRLSGHPGAVWSVSFNREGTLAATTSFGEARVWEVNSGRLLHTLIGHASWVTAVGFNPAGGEVATASYEETWTWDLGTGQRKRQLAGIQNFPASLEYSPDGRNIAVGGGADDNQIRIFEAATGIRIVELTGHESAVKSLAYNPDGKVLVSGDLDGRIIIWDPADGAVLRAINGHNLWVDSIEFYPNGAAFLSSGLDGIVRTWSVP